MLHAERTASARGRAYRMRKQFRDEGAGLEQIVRGLAGPAEESDRSNGLSKPA